MEGSKDEGTHDISAMISENVKKHCYDSDNKSTYYVQATKRAKSNPHDGLTSEDSCATSNPCGNSVESCSTNFNATGFVQNAKISGQNIIVHSLCDRIGGCHFHQARVCVVCDRFMIIGLEKVCKISVEALLKPKSTIGVDSYRNYYCPNSLKKELAKHRVVQILKLTPC
jgi:hypothetical protein